LRDGRRLSRFQASDAEEIKNSELGAESWQLEAF
jgi:hypothetical protein